MTEAVLFPRSMLSSVTEPGEEQRSMAELELSFCGEEPALELSFCGDAPPTEFRSSP